MDFSQVIFMSCQLISIIIMCVCLPPSKNIEDTTQVSETMWTGFLTLFH